MAPSWIERAKQFKSRLAVVAGFLLRSREAKAAKCKRLRKEILELKRQVNRLEDQLGQQDEEISALKFRVEKLEMQHQASSKNAAVRRPQDRPVGAHGYGVNMVALGTNLSRLVGFRGAAKALKFCFQWLGISEKTPHYTSIRNWLGRLGIAALIQPINPANDWYWIGDHSNQIGQEKVLLTLGIRASQLPAPGTTVKHEHVRVVGLKPGTQWNRESVRTYYQGLAGQIGYPRGFLADSAVELQEGTDCLKQGRSDTIFLKDFKHHAANVFKSLIGNDERFKEFSTFVGQTRSAIQQTELAHLTPPTFKVKARFMNLAAILEWASVISWLLEHPEAKSRDGFTVERLDEKLGWLRAFRDELAVWRECQSVISRSVTFINKQGVYRDVSVSLRSEIAASLLHETSQQLAKRLIDFVSNAETQLNDGERAPLSTEIIESCFALYKQLERQHSKGGFTSLIATLPALLRPTTSLEVEDAFRRVSLKDMREWIATNLGATLNTRRRTVYNEYKTATKSATKQLVPI